MMGCESDGTSCRQMIEEMLAALKEYRAAREQPPGAQGGAARRMGAESWMDSVMTKAEGFLGAVTTEVAVG